MKSHEEWRIQTLPVTFTEEVGTVLQKGVLYFHGRDHRFRPILILRANELSKLDVYFF